MITTEAVTELLARDPRRCGNCAHWPTITRRGMCVHGEHDVVGMAIWSRQRPIVCDRWQGEVDAEGAKVEAT